MITQPTLIRPDVPLDDVARKGTLGKAIEFAAELAGLGYDKQLEDALRSAGCPVDKTQLSRWQSGQEGIKWEKLEAMMDVCGNDAPILWMLYQRGYDLHSLRKRESETERELREAREDLARERMERQAVEESMRRILTGKAAS